ncbi:zonular occludens toxin domain-containing protein [Polaromonas aquatica]|uniref:zonular occludens toxin domain-containing protein n=1 Tax=Polaromonas aquatica TaxID=332657 RepID=UPI003D662471
MITLITGVPGSGKSLHAVAELLLPMQGATVEHEGEKVPRVLHTNIKNLLLDHVHIDAKNLNEWHTWAKPGALICFDEVQEVWRPRSMGAQTPECIAKLEIHRHMAVDFVLITQHPMLLDQNIRRLVGRHLHVRRIANMPLAVVYEWDHASNPSMVKSAITTRPWRYPKGAYKLYKSAEAHTKQPRRLPAALLVMLLAAAGLAYGVPTITARLSERYNPTAAVTKNQPSDTKQARKAEGPLGNPPAPANVPPGQVPETAAALIRPLGCISTKDRCACYDETGLKVEMSDHSCRTASRELVYILREKLPVLSVASGKTATVH